MIFVDGSNLLVELGKVVEGSLRADKPPKDVLHRTCQLVTQHSWLAHNMPQRQLIRSYWFGSYTGDDSHETAIAETLRQCAYEPVLFKRRDGREKGVDIALTTEVLVNAFHKNYDIGLLVAGDEDYVRLVQEVKRYGVIMWGTFFPAATSPRLWRELDHFLPIESNMTDRNGVGILQDIGRLLKGSENPA